METSQAVIEKFSNPEVVPHGFIDSSLPQFKASSQLSELHSKASLLLSQVDHHSQDLTWQLENLTNELLRTSNKVNYEIEILRSDASNLADDMKNVSLPKVDALKQLDNSAITQLQRLDIVKNKMKEVQKVFDEANEFNEDKIEQQVNLLLESDDLESALKRVERCAELVQVWKGTSAYSAKQKFVSSLRKKVENALNKTDIRSSSETASSPSANPSPNQPSESDGYYGLIEQLQRKIGY